MKNKKQAAKQGKLQFILRLILIVLLSLFLGGSVYSINAKRVMNNLLPMPFGVGSAVVLSGSMEPELSVNDLVFVRAAEDYEIGDVVVYQSNGELVIHRIIAASGTSFTTQGDSNDTPDPAIERSAVKGKLALAIPFLGLLVRGMQTLPGILAVVFLAVLLMRLSWRRERDASDAELEAIKAEIRRLKSLNQEETAQNEAEANPHQQ